MNGSRIMTRMAIGRYPPTLLGQTSLPPVDRTYHSPKADRPSSCRLAQLALEAVPQCELPLVATYSRKYQTYTNHSQRPSNDAIKMRKRTPPKSPPGPPNPNIFLKRRSLTLGPDIHFSLHLIFFLPALIVMFVVEGGMDEMIEWDGEDEE